MACTIESLETFTLSRFLKSHKLQECILSDYNGMTRITHALVYQIVIL